MPRHSLRSEWNFHARHTSFSIYFFDRRPRTERKNIYTRIIHVCVHKRVYARTTHTMNSIPGLFNDSRNGYRVIFSYPRQSNFGPIFIFYFLSHTHTHTHTHYYDYYFSMTYYILLEPLVACALSATVILRIIERKCNVRGLEREKKKSC